MVREKANMFGFSLIGDGTKIKRMPLINKLAISGSKPPGVIAIPE